MPDMQKKPDVDVVQSNQNLPSRAGEVIRLISNAELKAEERLKNAGLEAKKVIEDAKLESEKLSKESERKADDKIRQVRNLTEENGRDLILSLMEKSKADCDTLKEEARSNIDSAADAVIKKVLESWQ